jgi:hypothetical protein
MQYWAQAQAQMQQLNSAMAMVNGGAQVGTNGGVSTNGFHGNDERRENKGQVKVEEFTQAGGENRQGAGASNHMSGTGAMGGWSTDVSYMPPGYQT